MAKSIVEPEKLCQTRGWTRRGYVGETYTQRPEVLLKRSLPESSMIEKLRRGGQRVVLVAEVEKEEFNERNERRVLRRRDRETGAARQSKKTSLALTRQDMPIYAGAGERDRM